MNLAARSLGRLVLIGALLVMLAVPASAEKGGAITEAVLAPRSGPRGATMFKVMAPAQTGIVTENNFADPKMWTDREKEFALGATGTGVAVGDYDGDGRPDVFVVSKTERCRLYRNLGDWKFEDVTDKAGVGGGPGGWMGAAKNWVGMGAETADSPERWKQGATFVDINNDGRLDLYLCRFGAPNLLYMNQGDGTFKEEAALHGLALNDASGMGNFCDYDRDGWLDVYVHTTMLSATDKPNGQIGRLFHNNGDGKFTEVTQRAGIVGETISHSATWWDFDNDGWPDLYVANDFAPADRMYRNNRDGTFTDVVAQVAPHVPYSSMGADLGDVNNDGLIDFLASDMAATTHEKDQRGIATSREQTVTDFDAGTATQYSRNALLLNTNTKYFLEAANLAGLAASDWTWSLRLEDLDNDGRLDVHVTNGMVREYQNADLRDQIVRADTIAESRRIMRSSPVFPERHLAFRNLGDLQFADVSTAWGLDQNAVSFGAAFADFDGDGDLDLVFANYQAGATVLRNDSDSGHRLIVALRGTRSNRFGAGATVRIETATGVQVRMLVLDRGYMSGSEPVLHFGLGEESAIKRLTIAWPSGLSQLFENLAADRRYTITEPDAGPRIEANAPLIAGGAQFVEESQTRGLSFRSVETFDNKQQLLSPLRFDRRGPALAVGDLDRDGHDEFVIGGTGKDPLRIVSGARAVTLQTGETDDGPVVIFDADGDGLNDLLVTKATTGVPRLFLNEGQLAFRAAPENAVPAIALSAGAAAVADFDHDGKLDVFLGARVLAGSYPLPPRSVLLANRGGRFEDVTAVVAPGLRDVGLVTSALWSDVDADGWIDLLVAVEWGNVKYFHNDHGARFEDWTERSGFAGSGTGWWTSLASADFNGDGRPDYVVGNVGLNTPYHADEKHPTLIAYGEFAGRGSAQIVEAYYEGEKRYPRRTSKVLGAKLPSIRRQFPRNDAYARATLEEVLGAEALGKARWFAATELRSGVFLSQSDGRYQFTALPRIAQIAPLQGIVTGDFDGDGHADIYALQNSYAPIPQVGHFDGGLSQLLRGDGHGNFAPVPPAESGLLVAGDAKALTSVDFNDDGWPDFMVTRNNDLTLAFRNKGVPGRWSLRVDLRGPNGNVSGIGAHVTVELSDGSAQSVEIGAQTGYFGQSGGSAFFGSRVENPPRRVRVRWPTGAETTHEVPSGASKVVARLQE
ncbi:MAG: FG-GAP-like repeat-containing protein [Opitutus sp.]